MLSTIAKMMVSGGVANIFATGEAGEFVASAIFMLAYDRALASLLSASPETSYLGMPVSVGAYLDALLGSDAVASVANGCALLNAFMCILQVVVLDEMLVWRACWRPLPTSSLCCAVASSTPLILPFLWPWAGLT